MGVGKTTLGKRLALALNMPFADTDTLVEQRTGLSVEQLFETRGEEAFRQLEADVLHSISSLPAAVIATGGGLPCYHNNMEYMNTHGLTVYIKAAPAFIYSRLIKAKKPRPLIKSLDKEQLMHFIERKISEREAWYLMSKMELTLPQKSPESTVNTISSAFLTITKQG